MTHDVADDGFHEIQLSGKQLVALFMITTVVSVVIFLCGVLVGRGVHTDRPTVTADAALTTPASPATPVSEQAAAPSGAVAEPPSPPAGDELTYRKRLEGEGSPADDALKPAPSNARAASTPGPAKLEPVAPAKPAPAEAATAPRPSAAAPAQGGRSGRWIVQLVALRDRGAAASIVQRLSAKGYPAFLVNPSGGSGKVYRVQVGRYDDRNEAERVSRRLEKEEKFHPWISR